MSDTDRVRLMSEGGCRMVEFPGLLGSAPRRVRSNDWSAPWAWSPLGSPRSTRFPAALR